MTANRATDNSVDDGDATLGRESGIVKIVEREASPVTGAEEPEKDREDGIDVEPDFDHVKVTTPTAAAPAHRADAGVSRAVSGEIASEDDSIEVADDEIETADVLPARPTQPSPEPSQSSASLGVMRSRPPVRPSARPRTQSSSSALPPPRSAPWVGGASGAPHSSPPSGADPWLLANKTLELRHAHARIAELEEHVAFRDARIIALEEKLEKAQLKVGELERKLSPRVGDVAKAAQQLGKGGAGATASKPAALDASTRFSQTSAASPRTAESAAAAPPIGEKSAVESPASTSPSGTDAGAPGNDANGRADASGTAWAEAIVAPREVPAAEPSMSASAASEDGRDDFESDEVSNTVHQSDSTAPAPPSGGGEPTEEDLRQISGIGPRFEAALRKHGITRLSQIAAWSDADVRQVAKVLKIPKSRIVKGRWVESAREAIGTRAATE